jgi:predicted DCC family thiol-disulfide oxidoreductase YuxK
MATNAKKREIDLENFPPGTLLTSTRLVCLACIFDLFTEQLGLAPRTAYSEIKRYAPTPAELSSPEPARPFFDSLEKHPRCPYCDAAKKWHARLTLHRIEGSKLTDPPRRALVKSLPKADDQFQISDAKSTRRAVFFEWLDALGQRLDFTDESWLIAATRALLERGDPKTNWAEVFDGVRAVRRSQRLAEGWERDGSRLFLAPALYGDALLVQYLVSRSQAHGGVTFEGRLTLNELVRRLRYSGYLDARGITEREQFDVLEKLIEQLAGGDEAVKLHYILDRRDFLEKVKTVYSHYA